MPGSRFTPFSRAFNFSVAKTESGLLLFSRGGICQSESARVIVQGLVHTSNGERGSRSYKSLEELLLRFFGRLEGLGQQTIVTIFGKLLLISIELTEIEGGVDV